VVFWTGALTKVMQQRVVQLQGTLQPAVDADTTHVVCPPGMTARQAADRLKGCSR